MCRELPLFSQSDQGKQIWWRRKVKNTFRFITVSIDMKQTNNNQMWSNTNDCLDKFEPILAIIIRGNDFI